MDNQNIDLTHKEVEEFYNNIMNKMKNNKNENLEDAVTNFLASTILYIYLI